MYEEFPLKDGRIPVGAPNPEFEREAHALLSEEAKAKLARLADLLEYQATLFDDAARVARRRALLEPDERVREDTMQWAKQHERSAVFHRGQAYGLRKVVQPSDEDVPALPAKDA